MDYHDELRDGKQWMLPTPESTAEERREIQEFYRRQNEIAGRYRELSIQAGVSTSILACINEVRKHYEETGNVYIVASLQGAGNQLYLSKDSAVCAVLRRDHFPRRVKGKTTVIPQYIIINFETNEVSLPWKPIDEGAARGVVPGTDVKEEAVEEPKTAVAEAEQFVIHSKTGDVSEDNPGIKESRPLVNLSVGRFFTVPSHIRQSGTPDSYSPSSMSDVSSIETGSLGYESLPPVPQFFAPRRTTSGWTAINHPPEIPVEHTILAIPAPSDDDEETILETDDSES